MLLRYSLGLSAEADAVEQAVREAITSGARTADMVAETNAKVLSTSELGDHVRTALAA
jgi:3-isopropylmalate dehydrogenase